MINTTFTKWVQLVECKTLKPNQRIILISILNLHNIEGWDFTPLSVLNERSGIGITALKDNLSKLCKLELVEKVSNHNRKKSGSAPNDYIPNYTNILNLLNSQVVGNRPLKDKQVVGNRPLNKSENDHLSSRKTTTRIIEEKKEKNNSLYYSTYNDSTRKYMVFPENENKNKQKTNNMNIIITDNTENGNPTNALLGFDEADKMGWDSSTNEETTTTDSKRNINLQETLNEYAAGNNNTKTNETNADSPNAALLDFLEAFEKETDSSTDVQKTATDTTETQINDRGQVLTSNVVSCSTDTEKTQQEQNKEGNRQTDTEDEETDSPNHGDNTNTRRMMNQALQRVLKNRRNRNTAETTDENEALNDDPYKSPRQKIYNAFNASIKREETAAANIQNTQIIDRREDLTPQVNDYSTAAEKTPQEQNIGEIWQADTAETENGANTAAARPIFNTIHTAAEWEVRNAEDSCWQETFEHAAANLANTSETEIRTLLNKAYKDWKNNDPKINAKMIADMKTYVSYKYQICLDKREKRETDNNNNNPISEAFPTVTEIENLDLCHISKNKDILNILSAGCKRLDTVILALNKAIEFTQIYRIATPQLYYCITNAMALIDNYPTVSDKKAKYVTDLATHLCEMLQKIK